MQTENEVGRSNVAIQSLFTRTDHHVSQFYLTPGGGRRPSESLEVDELLAKLLDPITVIAVIASILGIPVGPL